MLLPRSPSLFLAILLCRHSPALASASPTPSLDAARQNAFQIFNAVHSAMRQWGSSVNHNGMSFFLATVPGNNVFYHGRHTPGPPASFECLASEFEHAFGLGQSWNGDEGGIGALDKPPAARSGDFLWEWRRFQ